MGLKKKKGHNNNKNILNLMKTISLQIGEAQQNSSRIDAKESYLHMLYSNY